MKKSSAYWQKRFQAVEEMHNQAAKGTVQAVTPAFDQAQAQIEKEINAWYGRFAKNNNISMVEAKRLLNTRELKEFRWDVEEYIKYGRQNAIDQQWMKQLENASARFHISRLEALKIRAQNAAEQAFGNELDQLDQMAARTYMDGYYHTAYEIQRGLGIGFDVSQIDDRKLKNVLSKPWTADKMTFSDRIWKSKTQLVDALHTELTRMCILGKAPDQSISAIARKMNVSKGQAGRLVMTEAAYFGSAAQRDCFNDLEVEFFEIIATLDNKTSEICQEMDGKVFPMSEYQIGSTAPPFHVWCRSCTAPWFDDNDDGTRAARDEFGNTYYVPASMKYDDWKKTFVDGGSKDGLKPVVSIEDLKKRLAEKELDLTLLDINAESMINEQTEFLSGMNNPAYKRLHDMSDKELEVWERVLGQENDKYTAEYEKIRAAYDHYYERPHRTSPDRKAWDEWHEKIKAEYGVENGAHLFDKLEEVQQKRTFIKDQIRDTKNFNEWKSKFKGKTAQYYEDEIGKLTKSRSTLEAEVKALEKQIDDAIKAQAEAAYNAWTLREIQDEIIKKHETILKTSEQKREFADIVEGMTKERANLYEKMTVNFDSSNYYEEGTGWYAPDEKRIHMDLNSHPWDTAVGRNLEGAWKTKFHEEMHQLDHVIASRKSPLAMLHDTNGRYMTRAFTAPTTVTGKKMIEAIDEDVLNFINKAVDWDVATNGVTTKKIKSLGRISTDAKNATIRYLKVHYPTRKDRATIDTLTDAIGLTTNGNLHPYKYGYWGHDKSYCKEKGKKGATSEAWANLGCFFLRNETEVLDVLTDIMPNTVKVYREVFDEVVEYAKTNALTYTP